MQQNHSLGNSLKSLFAAIAIPVCLLIAILIYVFIFGADSNFVDNNPANHPVSEGIEQWLGTIHKGGYVVPVLLSLFLIVITFTIERFLTIFKANGRGNMDAFLRKIKVLLSNNDINAAIAECDKQRGSLANVVKSGLLKYKQVANEPEMDKEQKLAAIQKELEEATTLELPMLERNLVIIATVASVATLLGLFGTVLGMIRAFAALATAGAPDAVALSTGISEALINTALGIGTSAVAIIFYNYFTNKIDGMTYRIDEASFSITQSFAANYRQMPAHV